MNHPPLTSRGVFVPTYIIFHPELPSAVLVTWIQLRCLARNADGTPPLSIAELASIIGIHPARLYRHLARLQDISALSWHDTGHGKITLIFPIDPSVEPEQRVRARNFEGHTTPNSEERESRDPASYFPPRILGYLSFEDDEEEPPNVGETSEGTVFIGAERARSLPKLNILRDQEHAYLSK